MKVVQKSLIESPLMRTLDITRKHHWILVQYKVPLRYLSLSVCMILSLHV